MKKYIGSRQNIADFQLTNGQTVSVKSNKSQSKVCPSRIGQLTKKRFCEKFNLHKDADDFQIKYFIFNNIFKCTFLYYRNLFICDYVLWVFKKQESLSFDYFFIDRKNAFRLKPLLLEKKNSHLLAIYKIGKNLQQLNIKTSPLANIKYIIKEIV